MISDILKGFGLTFRLLSANVTEKEFQKGGTTFVRPAFHQAIELESLIFQMQEIIQPRINLARFSFYSLAAQFGPPLIIAAACDYTYKHQKESPWCKKGYKVCYFLHCHFGNFCKAAYIVSSLALLRMNRTRGMTNVAILLYDLACKRGWVSEKVKKPLNSLLFISATALGIFHVGSWASKMGIISLVAQLSIALMLKKIVAHFYSDLLVPPGSLTITRLRSNPINDIALNDLVSDESLILDHNHVHAECRSTPQAPQVDIQQILLKKWGEADWKQFETKLTAALNDDDRWLKIPDDEKPDKIAYLQEGLKEFSKKTALDYKGSDASIRQDVLHNYASHIALFLAKTPTSQKERENQIDALIEIGIHGPYCDTGYPFYVKQLHMTLFEDHNHLDLQSQILSLLQKTRNAVLNEMAIKARWYNMLALIEPGLKANDTHKQQAMIAYFGPTLGLEFTEMFTWSQTPPSEIAQFYTFDILVNFYKKYQRCIVQVMQDAIDGDLDPISKARVNQKINFDQLKNWFKLHQIPLEEAFPDGRISKPAVRLLLIGLGIGLRPDAPMESRDSLIQGSAFLLKWQPNDYD